MGWTLYFQEVHQKLLRFPCLAPNSNNILNSNLTKSQRSSLPCAPFTTPQIRCTHFAWLIVLFSWDPWFKSPCCVFFFLGSILNVKLARQQQQLCSSSGRDWRGGDIASFMLFYVFIIIIIILVVVTSLQGKKKKRQTRLDPRSQAPFFLEPNTPTSEQICAT